MHQCFLTEVYSCISLSLTTKQAVSLPVFTVRCYCLMVFLLSKIGMSLSIALNFITCSPARSIGTSIVCKG